MMTGMLMSFQFSAQVHFDEQVKLWVAYVPNLKIGTQAPTETEALRVLHSGLQTFFSIAVKRRMIDDVLLASGAEPLADGKRPAPGGDFFELRPRTAGKTERVSIDVPLHLAA